MRAGIQGGRSGISGSFVLCGFPEAAPAARRRFRNAIIIGFPCLLPPTPSSCTAPSRWAGPPWRAAKCPWARCWCGARKCWARGRTVRSAPMTRPRMPRSWRCGWKNPGDGFGLILAQRLADRAPVRHVENEFCSGTGGQQLGRAPRRVQAAAAMGFVKNRNASVLGDPVCDCKN